LTEHEGGIACVVITHAREERELFDNSNVRAQSGSFLTCCDVGAAFGEAVHFAPTFFFDADESVRFEAFKEGIDASIARLPACVFVYLLDEGVAASGFSGEVFEDYHPQVSLVHEVFRWLCANKRET
jgi:hypothetical protein